MDLTPDELMAAVRDELARVHGKGFAQAVILEYGRGWFYLSYPRRHGRRWVIDPVSKTMRRADLETLLEELKARPRHWWPF